MIWFVWKDSLCFWLQRFLNAYKFWGLFLALGMQSRHGCDGSYGCQGGHLSCVVSDKNSTWYRRIRDWDVAINALIFLLMHIPISSQGFPITKHNDKPEGRGARMMKPTEISFTGHRMEQKRWMVNLLEWRLSGTITIDTLHNNGTMEPLWFIIFPAPKTMYNMAGFYTWHQTLPIHLCKPLFFFPWDIE